MYNNRGTMGRSFYKEWGDGVQEEDDVVDNILELPLEEDEMNILVQQGEYPDYYSLVVGL